MKIQIILLFFILWKCANSQNVWQNKAFDSSFIFQFNIDENKKYEAILKKNLLQICKGEYFTDVPEETDTIGLMRYNTINCEQMFNNQNYDSIEYYNVFQSSKKANMCVINFETKADADTFFIMNEEIHKFIKNNYKSIEKQFSTPAYLYFESHFFQKGNQVFILNICDYAYDWTNIFEKIKLFADNHHLKRGFSVCWDEFKD